MPEPKDDPLVRSVENLRVEKAAVEAKEKKLIAVAEQTREGDFADDATVKGADAGGLRSGLGVCGCAAARDEGKRHAVNFGIFGVEAASVVGGVTHATQGAADHLLA